MPHEAILDGELVCLDDEGQTLYHKDDKPDTETAGTLLPLQFKDTLLRCGL